MILGIKGLRCYLLAFQLTIRKRSPQLEITNEEDRDRPPSIGFRPRRNRKLSLVEELAQKLRVRQQ